MEWKLKGGGGVKKMGDNKQVFWYVRSLCVNSILPNEQGIKANYWLFKQVEESMLWSFFLVRNLALIY